MAQDPGWPVKAGRLARCWVALIAAACAACVTAEPLSVAALRAAVAEQSKIEPYSHDLAADLAWIQAMPVLERLAADIAQFQARFIAVGGERWSVPGVPAHLYCLISPASLRPIPIGEPPATALERALSAEVGGFIVPYNRLLAEYYAAEYGWECSADGQSMP